jgi:hypothetical protein
LSARAFSCASLTSAIALSASWPSSAHLSRKSVEGQRRRSGRTSFVAMMQCVP